MGMLDAFRRVFAPSQVEERAGLSTPPGSNVPGWLSGAGVGLPHEPFAGAWQRNLDGAAAAGPNIYAYGAVFACITIISSDVCKLPLRVLRQTETGNRVEHRNHPSWKLLRKPNFFQTSLQFVQQYMTSKLTHGNTYVYLLRDARGIVNEMYVLDPHKVTPLIAEDGSIFYRLSRGNSDLAGNSGNAGDITVPARAILHDRAATLWHPLVGVSPLFAAGVSAMTGARILGNSERFFANMSRTSGVLFTTGKMEAAVAKKLQDEWEKNYSGRGVGRTAVLTNGLDYKPMTINAADAELVNQLRWTVEDVARVYRVPGFKLGDLNKVSFRNSEQMSRDYYQGCLSYHIEAFEQCMEAALELAPGVEIEFDLRPLFRTETDTRYKSHQEALNAGWMSVNEVRAEEDLPPVKGGEVPRIQAQYIPIDKANGEGVNIPGMTPAPSPAPAPAPDDEEDPEEAKGLSGDQLELALDEVVHKFLGDPNGN